MVEAARRKGLAVIGWVEGNADRDAAIAAAQSTGLAAVALEGFTGRSNLPVIPWGPRAKAPWESTAAVLPVTENVWPGLSASAEGGDSIDAGPTGLPWLNLNSWYIQLARARTQAVVWAVFDPPRGRLLQPWEYVMAVADPESAGGRWVISLDDRLRAALAAGSETAGKTWAAICEAISFFDNHPGWRSFRSLGLVGVVSDFSESNFDLSGEILNLMARRDLMFRPIWAHEATESSFSGLKAVVYADNQPPAQSLRQLLTAFVKAGGLLIAGPAWKTDAGLAAAGRHPRFDLLAFGKGRLAIAHEDFSDPYQVAVDTQILLSHANDLVRFYNSGSTGGTQYTASPDGKQALLQVLSYGGSRAAGLMTIWLRDAYRTARLWRIGASGPVPVEQTPAEDFNGFEYKLPPLPPQGYFALEFDT